MKTAIIGIDPSSKRIAATVALNGVFNKIVTKQLSKLTVTRNCYGAERFVFELVMLYRRKGYTVFVFIEDPVYMQRAGAGSLIPQCRINGALHAGCGRAGVESFGANIKIWKKEVVGNGNAGKPMVKSRMKMVWEVASDAAGDDQDAVDSTAICAYGIKMIDRSKTINKRSKG